MPTFLLFESALGYALFQRQEMEEIALSKLQQNILDYSSFSKMIKFVSFAPFETPEHGLENANNISEGILHEFLENFLEMNLSKMKDVRLGLFESKLGGAIQESMKNVTCFTDDAVFELLRGIRFHIHKLIKGVKKGDVEKAQLGLSHAYSRAKVKFNVNKADNMIIQAIAMLDQLDKDVNTFSMRMREWYGWHFPELNKLVKDNASYSKIVLLIRDRATLTDESMDALTAITKDEQVSRAIVQAAKSSMGTDCSEYDMINIELFANKVVSLSDYQAELTHYLQTKMHDVAPNLTCLLGEKVGARLISKAGSMINLSKCPASTLQILGAEKALFRALKTRGNTPKYGLIYNSSFISKASKQNKGKISRYLANKCSVAVRIDSFQDTPTSKFGEMLRDQVEERLAYYEQGGKGVELKKNIDLMREVQKQVSADEEESMKEDAAPTRKSSIKRKRSSSEDDDEEQSTKKQKTETPSKKNKKSEDDVKTPESKSSSEEKKSSKKSDKKAKKAAKAAKKAEKAAKKKKE